MRIPGIVMLASVLLVTGLAEPRPVLASEPPAVHAGPVAGPVNLLSYNVEGLPWPLTHGRTDAAAAIAAELRALHARGEGPQVVVVQEAFGAAQKAIGAAAGYRYAAFGPTAAMRGAPAATADEAAFEAAGSVWHGETEAPHEDSGLAIFSDYPILWARRIAFPRFACAGYDCLANKGVLAVALRIPGRSAPLIVVDTHLNSRAASGVDDDRSFYAYRHQVAVLRDFVASLAAPGSPLVLAGDFNVGNDAVRQAYLSDGLFRDAAMTITASESSCGDTCRVITPVPSAARAKTIVAYRGPIAAQGRTTSFGALADGTRLSDHIGVMRSFAFPI